MYEGIEKNNRKYNVKYLQSLFTVLVPKIKSTIRSCGSKGSMYLEGNKNFSHIRNESYSDGLEIQKTKSYANPQDLE